MFDMLTLTSTVGYLGGPLFGEFLTSVFVGLSSWIGFLREASFNVLPGG